MARRRISLLTLIVLPVALVVVLVVAMHSAWVQQAWYRFAQESFLDINDQVAGSVEAQLDAILDTPQQMLTAAVGAIRMNVPAPADDDALQRYFVNQVRAHPAITNLSLGTDDGRYINAYRAWEEGREVMVSSAGPDGVISSFHVDRQGRASRLFNRNTGFDVTQRPWYRAAAGSDDTVWFPAYTFFSGATVAIGMSQRIGLSGDRQGVVAVDISVDDLSRLLASLDVARRGAAFIMTREGMLLADSSGMLVSESGMAAPRIRRAQESTLPMVRRIADTVLAAGGSFRGVIPNGADADLVHARRYSRHGGLELIIGVSAPRSAYAETLDQEIRNGMLVATLISIVGLLVIFLVGRMIAGPVRQLTDAIAHSDPSHLPQDVPRSRIHEIDQLSVSFSRLSQRLRGVMTTLERQVQQRTAALETANAQLERLSRTDEVTGLANRRHFEETLLTQLQRAARSREPISLVIGDIDWFKDFNDAYGHPAGDRALTDVAQQLERRAQRSTDLVARIGGEEFAFLLPGLDYDSARDFAESVRQDLAARAFEHRGAPDGVITMSFGVASLVPEPNNAPEDAIRLVDAADKALYRAKNDGRNRVGSAGPAKIDRA